MPLTLEQLAKIRQKEAATPDALKRDPNVDYYHGWFFVTLNTRDQVPVLSVCQGSPHIADGEVGAPRCVYTELGKKVMECWRMISHFHPQVTLDSCEVMPEHFHGLLFLPPDNRKHLGHIIYGFMVGCSHAYWDTLGIDWRNMKDDSSAIAHRWQDRDHTRSYRGPALFVHGYNDMEPITERDVEVKRAYIRDQARKRLIQGDRHECFRKHRHQHSRNWTVERCMMAVSADRTFSRDAQRCATAQRNIRERLNYDQKGSASLVGNASLAVGASLSGSASLAGGASLSGGTSLLGGAGPAGSAGLAVGASLSGSASLAGGASLSGGAGPAAGASLSGNASLAVGASLPGSASLAAGASPTVGANLAVGASLPAGADVPIGLDFIGNKALLYSEKKLPLVCHRVDAGRFEEQREAVMDAARREWIVVSAFISQKERDIKQQLMVEGLPFVEILDNGFSDKYKGVGRSFYALAENRLCQLTPWSYRFEKEVNVSREMCLVMNELARVVTGRDDGWWKTWRSEG